MDELLDVHCRQITELKTPREFSNMGTSKIFDLGDLPPDAQQCAHSNYHRKISSFFQQKKGTILEDGTLFLTKFALRGNYLT